MDNKIYWQNGFYHMELQPEIPAGAIEITAEHWQELLGEQSKGKVIVEQNGAIVAVDADSLLTEDELTRKDAERQITNARAFLEETDYVANKFTEALVQGHDTTNLLEKYREVLAERQAKRDRINDLEALLN